MEIYDTDEVDGPVEIERTEEDSQRYDRGKMNLVIPNNLNSDLDHLVQTETATSMEDRNRLIYTYLCLGTFFMSVIILYLYPL